MFTYKVRRVFILPEPGMAIALIIGVVKALRTPPTVHQVAVVEAVAEVAAVVVHTPLTHLIPTKRTM
jgi:hypothetical protein